MLETEVTIFTLINREIGSGSVPIVLLCVALVFSYILSLPLSFEIMLDESKINQ